MLKHLTMYFGDSDEVQIGEQVRQLEVRLGLKILFLME